tara:strand:- start:81 stop:500 length:420 start_codon:yes stop_codon:yes gene_type:complete
MIIISKNIKIFTDEIVYKAIRSSGPGGQHVNKVSTGIHLQYDIMMHNYPEWFINRLMQLSGSLISSNGLLVIKATSYKSQARNKEDALVRMEDLFKKAAAKPRKRIKTKTPFKAHKNRLKMKTKRSQKKKLRRPPSRED